MTTTSPTRRPIDRLILVYAADSGFANAFIDSAKKLLTVKGCSLCAITHGLLGERSEWRECREELGVPIDVYHRDEVPEEVAAVVGDRLPHVVAEVGSELVPVLGPEALDRMNGDVADFKGRLQTRAAMRGLHISSPASLAASGEAGAA